MAATFTPDYEVTEIEVTPADGGRRRKITKFALAGVAVLGVGAALTSAAWSDDVFFGGSASTGDLDLEGRGTAGSGAWEATGNDNSTEVVIPGTAFTNVGPNVEDTHWIEVRNNGTVDVLLDNIQVSGGGALFAAGGAAASLGDVTEGASPSDRVLAPGEQAQIEIVVTGDTDWENGDFTGLSGTVSVSVHGTSDLTSDTLN